MKLEEEVEEIQKLIKEVEDYILKEIEEEKTIFDYDLFFNIRNILLKKSKLLFPPNISYDEIICHNVPSKKNKKIISSFFRVDIGFIIKEIPVDTAKTYLVKKNDKELNFILEKNKILSIKMMEEMINYIENYFKNKEEIDFNEISKEEFSINRNKESFLIKDLFSHEISKTSLHGKNYISFYPINYKNNKFNKKDFILAIEPFLSSKEISIFFSDEKNNCYFFENKYVSEEDFLKIPKEILKNIEEPKIISNIKDVFIFHFERTFIFKEKIKIVSVGFI